MNDDIQNVRLQFSCQQNWDAMNPVEGGKFCDKCNKKVHDFTDTKVAEFRKIMSENADVCGMFRQSQVSFVGVKLPVWKKWVSAAMLFIGINLFNKAQAQATLGMPLIQQPNEKKASIDESKIFGGITELSAEPAGGMNRFNKFIQENFRYSGNKTGQVIVQFNVEATGILTGFKVIKGLSREADAEALRVLSIAPKWKPSIYHGKPVKQVFTLPIKWQVTN